MPQKASDVRAGNWNPLGPDGERLTPYPTDEHKQVDLASIYALTKYAQERQVMIFGAAYGVDAVALRLFNVYGAGQALSNPYTGVLANFASRLINGRAPMISRTENSGVTSSMLAMKFAVTRHPSLMVCRAWDAKAQFCHTPMLLGLFRSHGNLKMEHDLRLVPPREARISDGKDLDR